MSLTLLTCYKWSIGKKIFSSICEISILRQFVNKKINSIHASNWLRVMWNNCYVLLMLVDKIGKFNDLSKPLKYKSCKTQKWILEVLHHIFPLNYE